MTVIPRTQTPAECIDLILYSPEDQPQHEFYLRIPIWFIITYYVFPVKFLRYISWCVLGRLGDILNEQKVVMSLDAETLEGGRSYSYRLEDAGDVFQYAVDVEAIKLRSRYHSSEQTPRDPNFLPQLATRDLACIFTGMLYFEAIHIVPHRKGNEWLQVILENRPNDDPEEGLVDIDDLRNGMLAMHTINILFDQKKAIILRTPNRLLDTTDVAPPSTDRNPPQENTSYPDNMRLTFQYLFEQKDRSTLNVLPHNTDAMFPTSPEALALPKPSALLLNYNFGVAAVEMWGKKVAPVGPERVPGKEARKSLSTKKRKRDARDEQDRSKEAGPSSAPQDDREGEGEDEDEGVAEECDADDIVIFFWGNSKAAVDRHKRKQQNLQDSVEEWKSSVAVE